MNEPSIATQYVRFTTTFGYEITVPIIGSLEAGLALNSDQIGLYGNTHLAPSQFVVEAGRIANAMSSQFGLGDILDPRQLDLWDDLNGPGIQFTAFVGPTVGVFTGRIEDLNSFGPNGEIRPSAEISAAYGGVQVELIIGGSDTDYSVFGIPDGSGISIGFGPGIGAGAQPLATFSIPLFGENGAILSGNYLHHVSSIRYLEDLLNASGTETPNISDIVDGHPAMKQHLVDQFSELRPDQLGQLLLKGDLSNDLLNLLASERPNCFPSGTKIALADGSEKSIEEIAIGDRVLAFDGLNAAESRTVTRLFENVTAEWLKLSFDDGQNRDPIIVTPGHRFLQPDGSFERIGAIIEQGAGLTQIVAADGKVVSVRARAIIYSQQTAHLFEEASAHFATAGAVALQPDFAPGWRSYNFEVEGLHTYIASGVRVHNESSIFIRKGDTYEIGYYANGSSQTDEAMLAAAAYARGLGLESFATFGTTSSLTIQPGDTLSAIAASNNTTIAAILAANPQISDPNLIVAGETLNIPDVMQEYGVVSSQQANLYKNSSLNTANEDIRSSQSSGLGVYLKNSSSGVAAHATLDELAQAIDATQLSYTPLLKKGDVATKWEVGGKMTFTGSKNVFTLEKSDNGTSTGLIKKEISVGGEGSSTQIKLDRTDTNNDGVISNADEASNVEVQWQNDPVITGAQIGQAFGSALGNAIGDSALERLAFSVGLGTVFESVGDVVSHLFAGDSFDAAVAAGFTDFDDRLGASAINAGIGFVGSFVVGEVIGGDSLAADLGRTVANGYVSAALSDVVVEGALEAGGEFVNLSSFNPLTAIASFFGSQLAGAVVQPEGTEAAVISQVFGTIGAIIGTYILPVIGTFVGQFIGEVFGAIIGNALFGDEDFPRAIVSVGIGVDGKAVNLGNYTGVDGMDGTAIKPAADAVVSGLNVLLERFGPDAKFAPPPWGSLVVVGYISTSGYYNLGAGYTISNPSTGTSFPNNLWNQTGFNHTDFNEAYKFAVMNVIRNGGVSDGDAWGRRVLHYGGWTNFNELADQLQVAADYRKYLADKDVIDQLITEAPDSSFAIGWLLTLAQATTLGFTNPDALHNLIEATDLAEIIDGSIYNDEIIAKAGNDTLNGGLGNDLLNGGTGADVLDGGAGLDTASYRQSTVGVSVDLNVATPQVSGGEASGDTLISIERLFGSDFSDTLTGDGGDNLLAGYSGNDVISGGAGDDTVEGGVGADVLDGGEGYDITTYAGSTTGVIVSLQEGTVLGTGELGDAEGDTLDGFEAISGSLHSDILTGNSGDNLLLGSSGNDFLEGKGGADRLLGGSGVDFAVYISSSAGVNINLATGVVSGGDAEGDTLNSIEYVIGSAFADTIIGNAFDNIIEGGAGADVLDGGTGNDAISYASSTAGVVVDLVNHTASGGDAEGDVISNFEHIIGSNFDDILTVGANNAVVLAGGGDDTIIPFNGNVAIDGGAGYDTVSFEALDNAGDFQPLFQSAGLFTGFQWGETVVYQGDEIYGVWNQVLNGATATDDLFSADTERYQIKLNSIEALRATEFDDIIAFSDIGQNVYGGGGNDEMVGSRGADTFDGESGNDTLIGGGGDDILFGGSGDDTLYGDGPIESPDAFYWFDPTGAVLSPGNDRLDGGTGNDVLRGFRGDDTYVFGRGYGQDIIIDQAFQQSVTITGKGSQTTTVTNVDAGVDTLEFGAGIDPGDIIASVSGDNLILQIQGTTDQITLVNFSEANKRIEFFKFTETGDLYNFTSNTAFDVVTVFSSQTLTGTEASESLSGSAGDDVISGLGGADTLYGSYGNDQLYGGMGADTLDGGAGVDTAIYNDFAAGVNIDLAAGTGLNNHAQGDILIGIENVIGSAVADTLQGDAGANVLWGIGGDDTIDGRGGSDTLYGQSGADTLYGAAGGDSLFGGDGNDVLYGQADSDWLDGGVGADTLDGGDGIDTASYSGSSAGVTVDLLAGTGVGGDAQGDTLTGIENVYATNYADTLTGDGEVNYLYGFGGADAVSGGSGDDHLYGGAGADVLDGGLDTDFARYDTSSVGVTVDLLAGTGVGGDAEGDTLTGIENLHGSEHNDILSGDGNANTLIGAAGVDYLYGNGGGDALYGGLGDDVLVSQGVGDVLDGGDGADTAHYYYSTSAVTANIATGVVSGGFAAGDTFVSIENLHGSAYDDVLTGDAGVNTLWGYNGDDTLEGGAGADVLDGGTGTDTASYVGSGATVVVSLVAGTGVGGDAEGDTLTGIENITGSAFDDQVTGDGGANRLIGGDGADQLWSLGGDDTLEGGEGNDTLVGGLGADTLDGGAGVDTAIYNDFAAGVNIDLAAGTGLNNHAQGDILIGIENVIGSEAADTLQGDAGANILWGIGGDDTIDGRAGDDTLYGQAGADTLYGAAGGDSLFGGDDNDVVYGQSGDDWLVGGAGADVLDGGVGTDTASYSGSGAGVTIDLLAGTGVGGDGEGDTLTGIENVIGSAYDDLLWGDAGVNTLTGGAGDDNLVSGTLATVLDGGDGTDWANYTRSAAAVTVNLATGVLSGGDAEGDTLISIEKLWGSLHNDILTGDAEANYLGGYGGDDTLEGGAGADVLDGGAGADTASYAGSSAGVTIDLVAGTGVGGDAEGDALTGIENITGSNVGTDWLYGDAGNNILTGLAGNDVLYGRDGADVLYGGAGQDLLFGGVGADYIDGGTESDAVSYQNATSGIAVDLSTGSGTLGEALGDTLVNIERVYGSQHNDTLIGDAGVNELWGQAGADAISGGAGDDYLSGGAGADGIDGGVGVDWARYVTSTAAVNIDLSLATAQTGGHAEGDILTSIENVIGSAYDDTLIGDAGANVLTGEAGDDSLAGGGGIDTLDGGGGTDTALFSGNFADYALSIDGTGGTIVGTSGTTTIVDIETLSFADRSINLDAVNNAPILVSALDNATLLTGDPLSLNLGGHFVDIDAADSLTYAATLADGSTLPSWLGFDVATGVLTGTAVLADIALLSIKVIATDGAGASVETLFDLNVTRPNVAPVALAIGDQAATQDIAFSFTVPTGTFTDADAVDVLTLSATQSDGSALPTWLAFDAATGMFSGTPANGDVGAVAVIVTATDLLGETVDSGFNVSVANVNDAPTASNVTSSVDEGQAYIVDLATLASDIDGDVLTYTLTSTPATGTSSLTGSVFTYQSLIGTFGPAAISYQVDDGNGGVATGAVDLAVNNINFAPTVSTVSASVNEGQSVQVDLAAYASDLDGDTLSYTLDGTPGAGMASISGSTLTYNSAVGGFGAQAVGFTVSDGNRGSVTADVDVTVNNINFAPTAVNGSGTVNEGQSFSIDLATLAADIDGDSLTYSIIGAPATGSATISGSTLTYASVDGAPGNYNIGYTVSDGQGGTASASIVATVVDVNDAPTAFNDSLYTYLTSGASFAASRLLENDADPDGDVLTVISVFNPIGLSSLALSADDFISFGIPSESTGSFSYTIGDGNGHTATATVSVEHFILVIDVGKPIAFDLDGDGIELVDADEADIFFDLNGDGIAEDTGWVDSDDGLLAYDKNDDGLITDYDEVSFVGYKEGARTDLEGLQAFDTNGDGVLDASDAEFGSFNVWQDANQNGVSDAGELRSLLEAGISSIALSSDATVRIVGDNVSFGVGEFTRTDGTTGFFSDTGFGTGQGLGDVASSVDGVADVSGLFGGEVVQLNASLDEVMATHFQSSLLVSSEPSGALVSDDGPNVSSLISAMASFDPKSAGDAQIGAVDEDTHVPALAAWVG